MEFGQGAFLGRVQLIGLLMLLGACQADTAAQSIGADERIAVVTPELPEGYPWTMGEGVVMLSGAARPYTTFDFSIGAMDAAVQFRKNYDCSGEGSCEDTGTVFFALRAHPDGNSEAEAAVFAATGVFATLPDGPATAQDVQVTITGPDGRKGKGLLSESAELSITAIQRNVESGTQNYGTISATIRATVCEAENEALIPGGACQEVTARFDTEVQYDSL